jgi:hypothetical protein
MRLGNRLEEADFEACALKRAHQPEADGGQTHAKIGGGDKKSLHANSLKLHGNGGRLCLTTYRNSVAKVIANRALCAPTAGKGLAYFFNTLRRVEHPGAGLPWRLVAQVLGVATGKLDHPMSVFVLMEACDRRNPFVRVVFAFARLLR